jgi:uncharacterized membrane protein YedE/YeeE
MSASTKLNLSAFFCGALFAVGLVVSGMTQPGKVQGFLDFAGDWDPSLALVMGGAVGTVFLSRLFVAKMRRPVLATKFPELPGRPVNARLVGGAAVFGIGWALAGYCPGPALVALGGSTLSALLFVPAMAAGIALADWVTSSRSADEKNEGVSTELGLEGGPR